MYCPLSYIELSRDNLAHNIKSLRGVAKKGTRFAVAVKGNAYGHGLREIVKMVESYADYFIVNSVEELGALRKVSKKQTFVLGYIQPDDLKKAIMLGCIMGIFSLEQLQIVNAVAAGIKKKQEIHIAVDALLGREGFLEKDLNGLFVETKKMRSIIITGMYAHFANIEDTTNFTHASKQIRQYQKMVTLAKKHGYTKLATHIAATSGLLVYEKAKGVNPIIRLGIGMYGLWPSEHIKYQWSKGVHRIELRPVLSWKTQVAQVKTLPAGRTIGYGLSYMTHEPTRVALIPQGYADGLGRNLSNKSTVLIGGTHCKILGRVSMNMFVVDVTHVPEVGEGDEVVLLGKQADMEITADKLAEIGETINYEITTKISPLLPRVVI